MCVQFTMAFSHVPDLLGLDIKVRAMDWMRAGREVDLRLLLDGMSPGQALRARTIWTTLQGLPPRALNADPESHSLFPSGFGQL